MTHIYMKLTKCLGCVCLMKKPQGLPSPMISKIQSFMSYLYDFCHNFAYQEYYLMSLSIVIWFFKISTLVSP